jgi:ABC-type transporter Mla subunit MlaD
MFSGETAEAILAEVREEISTVLAGIQGQESEIADAVARTHDLVTRNRDLFVSARPALAGTAASTVTGPEYMGYAL